MQNKRKNIALFLSIIMIFSVFPASIWAGTEDSISYKVQLPTIGIMNKVNSCNDMFKRTYLRNTDNNFNLVYNFKKTSGSNVKGTGEKGSALNYDTRMMHQGNGDPWKAEYKWQFNDPVLKKLIASGELSAYISADMTADKHKNFWRHNYNILDRSYFYLYSLDKNNKKSYTKCICCDTDAPDESAVFHENTAKVKTDSVSFRAYFESRGCKCGSSKVAHTSIGLIDDKNPSITSITASRKLDGEVEQEGFKAGEIGYLNLNFSENIRFASNTVPTNSVLLNLVILGAESNTQIDTSEIQAKLVELSGKRMSFKFTVPETINGKKTNVRIFGISSKQGWVNNLGGNSSFNLSLIGNGGSTLTLSKNLQKYSELTKTSSLVTDMAGNPVNWQGSSKNLSNNCFLDNVSPEVSSIAISGARISSDSNQTSQAEDWPEDIDRSAVFAGIGDDLTFSVKFSEQLKLSQDTSQIRAILNAKENNLPVTLTGADLSTIDNGVNGIAVSKLTFDPIQITKDMMPDGEKTPLKIIKLIFPEGTVDLRGNAAVNLENTEEFQQIPVPSQQQYLDTQLPIAKTNAASGKDNLYSPLYYTEGNEKNEFYFPITINDVDVIGKGAYASGFNGVKGSFALMDVEADTTYPFDYYVSASADRPEENQYIGGNSSNGSDLNLMYFTQVETGNYIHIKLRDDVKYNLHQPQIVIKSSDYAANLGYDAFSLDFCADYVAPEITSSGYKQYFDSDSSKGSLTVTVSVKDGGGVLPSKVDYQWVTRDAQPDSDEWIKFVGETEEGGSQTAFKIKISKNNLEEEKTHLYDLLLRAEDEKGNMSEEPARIPCELDLKKANANIDIRNGLDEPVTNVDIGMELKPYSGSDENMTDLPMTSVVMLKNPSNKTDDEYFVIALTSRDENLSTKEDLFKALKVGYNMNTGYKDAMVSGYSTWYKAKVTKVSENQYLFTDSEELSEDETNLLGSMLNPQSIVIGGKLLSYYGTLDLKIITAYGDVPQDLSVWRYSGTGLAPKNVKFFNHGCGEYTAFYLDSADGIYFVRKEDGSVDFKNSFYYKGEYSEEEENIELKLSPEILNEEVEESDDAGAATEGGIENGNTDSNSQDEAENGNTDSDSQDEVESGNTNSDSQDEVESGNTNSDSQDEVESGNTNSDSQEETESGDTDSNSQDEADDGEIESNNDKGIDEESSSETKDAENIGSVDPVLMEELIITEESNKEEVDPNDLLQNKEEVDYNDLLQNKEEVIPNEILEKAKTLGATGSNYERVNVLLPFTRIEGNLNIQEFKLSLAPRSRSSDTAAVNFGIVSQADGTEGLLWEDNNFIPGEKSKYLNNLDGAKIPFSLDNSLEPDWGIREIDFDSDDTYVAFYYTEHGINKSGYFATKNGQSLTFSDGQSYTSIKDMTPLVKGKPIKSGKEQTFVIPDGITDKTGFYTFEVSLKSLTSDQIKKVYYKDMFVNGNNIIDEGDQIYHISIKSEDNGSYLFGKSFDTDCSNIMIGTTQDKDGFKSERVIQKYLTRDIVPKLVYFAEDEGREELKFFEPDDLLGSIKIWNAASTSNGEAPSYAQWQNIDSSFGMGIPLNVINNDAVSKESSYKDAEGNWYVPIMRNGSNVLCYQSYSLNGELSPVKQINISTSDQAPEFELKFSNSGDADDSLITAFAEDINSINGAVNFNCLRKEEGEYVPSEKEIESLEPITITENGEYCFYVMDSFGNITIKEKNIQCIDNKVPTVTVKKSSEKTPENEFHVIVEMTDDKDITDGKVYLTFDEEYSSLLNEKEESDGGENEEEGTNESIMVEVPVKNDGNGIWNASNTDKAKGIYKTKTILSSDKLSKTVEIWGAFKFDDKGDAADYSNRILTFSGSDKAGNVSKIYESEEVYNEETEEWDEIQGEPIDDTYLELQIKNIKPAFDSVNLTSEDKVSLEFTAPVLVTTPVNSNLVFGKNTDTVAIYSNGICSLSYSDLFGEHYTEDVMLSAFSDFNANVKFSVTEPTRENVTAAIEIPEGSSASIEKLQGKLINSDDGSFIEGIISEDKKSAEITMTDNGNIIFTMVNGSGTTKDKTISVSNIDRSIEQVKPYIYYTAGIPEEGVPFTEGTVVAGLYCDEFLTGTNGPLTYTFTNGAKAGDAYTFEYEDSAKNKGSMTVTLPHDVISTAEDKEAPDYDLVFYSKLDYMNQQDDSYNNSTSLEEALEKLHKAQGYLLSFNIFDDSGVKLIVKNPATAISGYNDISDNIPGVTVEDRAVIVNENARFVVYLVDEKGNTTTLPIMDFNKIDNTAPTATVEYVAETFYSVIGYLNPNEDITVTNIAGVEKASGGDHDGVYYHKYLDNEDFVFYFKDEVGNTSSANAKVDWLDVSSPEITSVKWRPSGEGQGVEDGLYPPPTESTNKDVIAQIRFNKTIKTVKAYKKGTLEPVDSAKVEISFIQGGGVVTYHENEDIDLYFESYNGKFAVYSLGNVNCIDKSAFNVTENSHVSEDKQSVTYTFETDKDVFLAEDSSKEKITAKKNFTCTFTANGIYDMHFTDKAGNILVHTVTVDELDKESVLVSFNTSAKDQGAVSSSEKLNIKDGDTFYVKLSKAGTIVFGNKTVNAKANEWNSFQFDFEDGRVFYTIEVTDNVKGTKIYNYLSAEIPDTMSPTIIFATPTISVKEGSSATDILNKLRTGVTVSDNKDNGLIALIKSVMLIKGEVQEPVSVTDNMEIGKYDITYEAEDSVGNISNAQRILRIYDKNSLNLLINGESTEPESTMVVKKNDITLTIENLPSNGIDTEPCTVSYKAGIKTAGQMKIRSTQVETDSFTLPDTGFYTIYVQAQNRKDYITYVYIQK
ncbi:midas domain-containing protein [Anaerovorax odorimutans]|uniref:hypothetical protein n=1 Tax=Anaerovorax odorimutans TaxID=109327 RepID=UPI000412B878|nr:hypothetical protein [Anaerovorax odorimutans]